MKTNLSLSALASFLILSSISIAYAAPLSDIENSKYETAIQWMNVNKIISGYDDGTFKPENKVNRAEFVKIMSLTYQKANPGFDFEKEKSKYNTNCFKDVTKNNWYTPYVCYAKEVGIVKGYEDGTFKPSQNVSKVEALKIALNSLDISVELTATENYFSDTEKNAWYAPYIQTAYFNNLLEEKSGKYYPDNAFLRGEISNLVYKTYLINAPINLLTEALKSGSEIKEIANPNLEFPTDILSGQARKYFQIGDTFIALVLEPSMNIDMSGIIDWSKTPPVLDFSGILIAGKNDLKWQKVLSLEDVNPDHSSANNPYYIWLKDNQLNMSVIDQNGAGSGEGIMKIFTLSENNNFTLSDCRYYMPKNDEYEKDYLRSSMFVDVYENHPMSECQKTVLLNY